MPLTSLHRDIADEVVHAIKWTGTFGDERLTGALLDRLTHHVHILEMNGRSYRLSQSRARGAKPTP